MAEEVKLNKEMKDVQKQKEEINNYLLKQLSHLVITYKFNFQQIAKIMGDLQKNYSFQFQGFTKEICEQQWLIIHSKRKQNSLCFEVNEQILESLPEQRRRKDFLQIERSEMDEYNQKQNDPEKKLSGFNIFVNSIKMTQEEEKLKKQKEMEFLKKLEEMQEEKEAETDKPMFYKARFNEANNEEIIIEKEELTQEKVEEIIKKKVQLGDETDQQEQIYQFKAQTDCVEKLDDDQEEEEEMKRNDKYEKEIVVEERKHEGGIDEALKEMQQYLQTAKKEQNSGEDILGELLGEEREIKQIAPTRTNEFSSQLMIEQKEFLNKKLEELQQEEQEEIRKEKAERKAYLQERLAQVGKNQQPQEEVETGLLEIIHWNKLEQREKEKQKRLHEELEEQCEKIEGVYKNVEQGNKTEEIEEQENIDVEMIVVEGQIEIDETEEDDDEYDSEEEYLESVREQIKVAKNPEDLKKELQQLEKIVRIKNVARKGRKFNKKQEKEKKQKRQINFIIEESWEENYQDEEEQKIDEQVVENSEEVQEIKEEQIIVEDALEQQQNDEFQQELEEHQQRLGEMMRIQEENKRQYEAQQRQFAIQLEEEKLKRNEQEQKMEFERKMKQMENEVLSRLKDKTEGVCESIFDEKISNLNGEVSIVDLELIKKLREWKSYELSEEGMGHRYQVLVIDWPEKVSCQLKLLNYFMRNSVYRRNYQDSQFQELARLEGGFGFLVIGVLLGSVWDGVQEKINLRKDEEGNLYKQSIKQSWNGKERKKRVLWVVMDCYRGWGERVLTEAVKEIKGTLFGLEKDEWLNEIKWEMKAVDRCLSVSGCNVWHPLGIEREENEYGLSSKDYEFAVVIIKEFFSNEDKRKKNIAEELFNESLIGMQSDIAGIQSSTCVYGNEQNEKIVEILQKYYGKYDEEKNMLLEFVKKVQENGLEIAGMKTVWLDMNAIKELDEWIQLVKVQSPQELPVGVICVGGEGAQEKMKQIVNSLNQQFGRTQRNNSVLIRKEKTMKAVSFFFGGRRKEISFEDAQSIEA